MKNYCSQGFMVSPQDMLAFEFYVLDTPKIWAEKALRGMINKAISLLKNTLVIDYMQKNSEVVNDLKTIIPAIAKEKGVKKLNLEFTEKNIPERSTAPTMNVWDTGFQVEDYEDAALRLIYTDPERFLREAMENKFYRRRKALCDHWREHLLNMEERITIPSGNEDQFIDFVSQRGEFVLRKNSPA